MRFAFIQAEKARYPVRLLCRALEVSRSGFYKWLKATPSPRAQRTERIRTTVQEIYEQSHQIYGSYKIAEVMQSDDQMENACRNTVAAAMRELGLRSKVAKKFKPTTTVVDPTKRPADNVLAQVFTADAPNRKWVTDITYLPTKAGWVYLAAVLDLFSRKVVGWSIGDSLVCPIRPAADWGLRHSKRPLVSK